MHLLYIERLSYKTLCKLSLKNRKHNEHININKAAVIEKESIAFCQSELWIQEQCCITGVNLSF